MASNKLKLKNEISYNDLVDGCEIEVEENENSSSDEDAYDDEEFSEFKEKLANLEDATNSKDDSFEALKLKMESLTEDGLVLKKLVKWGTGIIIPPKSIVLIHYNAYVENEAEPFDSTYRRHRPFKFLLGEGRIIPGLDICIATMKNQEISKFIMSPEYGYGPMGCPPRIPPNANLLYEVEIVNFFESADAIDYEEMTPEEKRSASFDKIVSIRNLENKVAFDLFSRKLYRPAIARYRKLAELLEDVSVKDENEDKKREEYLLKTYLNLSQCYLNIGNPRKTLKYADLALKLDKENTKAMYRKGKGLMLNNEFEKSKKFLLMAKQKSPFNEEINAALLELDKRIKQVNNLEKLFAQKAFGITSQEKPKVQEREEYEEMKDFQSTIEKNIETFIDSSDREFSFSPGFTESEMRVIEVVAKKYGLPFVRKTHNGELIIKVCKSSHNTES